MLVGGGVPIGITSACAEQTSNTVVPAVNGMDHLRVCGADNFAVPDWWAAWGSPPRVRSRRPLTVERFDTLGITSACAEQTSPKPERRS